MAPTRIPIGMTKGRKVFFDPERRSAHLHVAGGTGAGKSKFLEHMIREDIVNGHGVFVIDPHGELYENLVNFCAATSADRYRKIHLIDPSLKDWRIGFNPLAHRAGEDPLNRIDNTIEALAAVWGGEDSLATPSIRTALRAIITVLMEKRQTLAEAFWLTRRKDENSIRAYVADTVSNPIIQEAWEGYDDLASKSPSEFQAEFGGPRRRLMEVLHDDLFREMFGQVENTIDFRKVMDNDEIVLVNFSPKHIGRDRARAIGALLIRELFHVATQRDVKYAKNHPCYLYVDECARYLTNDIEALLAETRKFGLHAILAHQWLAQIRERNPMIYDSVMAIQNKVIFGGLKDDDAELLANELFRTEYDTEVPVEILIKPTVVRYERTWLENWSEGESTSDVETSGSTTFESETTGISQVFDADGYPLNFTTGTEGTGKGMTDSSSTATARSSSHSHGASESFVPVLEDRPSAVHSLETIRHLAIKRLRSLPPRNAVVKGTGAPSFDIRTFDVYEKPVHPESRKSFVERVMRQSTYALSTENAKKAIAQRHEEFFGSIDHWKKPVTAKEKPDDWLG